MARLADVLNGAYLTDANKLPEVLNTMEYTARTDDQLRAEAEQRVGSLYNQKNLAINQQYARTTGSLKSQLDSLADTYAGQKEQAAENTKQAISKQDRSGLSRGMGRSSYLQATLGNMQTQGNKLLNQIDTAQTNQTNAINSQLQLADQQLGEILAAYQVDKETDILARMDELRSTDKTDSRAAAEYNNNLILALAERIAAQKAQEFDQNMAQEQLSLSQQELALRYGGASGGGNRVIYRDKTDDKDNKPRVLTGQMPINPNISTIFAGVKPITDKLGLPAVPANPHKTVFGNPATTAPKPATTSPFNYNKPYTKQGGSTLMNRLNSLSS